MRKRGGSLKEISRQLGISQSTASIWLRDVKLSKTAQRVIEVKIEKGRTAAVSAAKKRTKARLDTAVAVAEDTLRQARYDISALKIICAMIYWCEGAKTVNDSSFMFANSDPELMALFLKLLRRCFKIDETKFRVLLHLHHYHSEDEQLRFWSKVTNIPKSQFLKSYSKTNTGKNKRRGYQGCVSLRYHGVALAREISALARVVMKVGL